MGARCDGSAHCMEWRIIEKFFRENPSFIAKHHLDSYNDFVQHKLPATIRNIDISFVKNDDAGKPRHEVSVLVGGPGGQRVHIARPVYLDDSGKPRRLFPNDAMVKNLYYCSDVYADVILRYRHLQAGGREQEVVLENVRIGTIPIMVGSVLCALHGQPPETVREMGSCPHDQGGFFIVDGKEKVVVAQERIVTNRLFVTPAHDETKFALEAQIQCTSEDDPFKKTVMFYVCSQQNTQHCNTILVRIPDVGEDVPVTVAFRALGVESDMRILEHIGAAEDGPLRDFLYYTLYDNRHGIYSQRDAMNYLKDLVRYKSVDHVRHIITNDFLRHTGPDLRAKAVVLGRLVRRLVLTRVGALPPNNRDSFTHKRLDTSGELVYQLFRDSYNQLRRNIRKTMEAMYVGGGWAARDDLRGLVKQTDIMTVFDASIMDGMFRASLKGNWGLENDPTKGGIVQELNRVSLAGTQSHMRKMNTPMSREIKLTQPRKLDTTQWGVACPVHSPDGGSIGLDKHLATLTHITIDTPTVAIMKCLVDLGCKPLERTSLHELLGDAGVVHLNNNLFGVHPRPAELAARLRLYRRNGLINAFTSVVTQGPEVHVFCHAGRMCRPLLVVGEGRKLVLDDRHLAGTWDQMFAGLNSGRRLDDPGYVSPGELGVSDEDLADNAAPVEFIDIEEAFNTLIAMAPSDIAARPLDRFTHCEIHPTTMLGIYANSIPYAHHNPAPRNVFSGAQGKQAIGVYATNFNHRMDTASYVMHYPQRPLVTTRYNVLTGSDYMPNGENLIVALMTYTGYNQEDAIIVNRSSVERGMFNLTYFKSIAESEVNDMARGRTVLFCNPQSLKDRVIELRVRDANPDTVDEYGMPRPGAHIQQGDMILGKLGVTVTQVAGGGREVRYADQSVIADKTVEGVVDRVVVFKNEAGNRTAKVRMREFRAPAVGDKLASRHSQKGVIGVMLPREDMPFTADGVVPDIIINPHAIPTRMTAAHLLECLVSKAGAAGAYVTDATAFERHDVRSHGETLVARGMERHGNEVLYNGFTGEQISTDIFVGPTFYFRLKHMVEDKINYRSTGPVAAMTRQPIRGRADDGGLRLGEMERDVMLASGTAGFLKEAFLDKSDAFPDGQGRVLPYAFKLMGQEIASMGIDMRLLTGKKHENVEEKKDDLDDEPWVPTWIQDSLSA